MYTVRIRKLGSGEDVHMSHHDYLEDAISVSKKFVKTRRHSATIWYFDKKLIKE